MSTTKYIATDKDPSELPPQARAIVKAAKNGATKERILKALEGGDTKQKPGRILSYYKTLLVKKGFLKVEEPKKEKAAKKAKKVKVADAAPAEAPATETEAPAEAPPPAPAQ
jgi:predicted transcriptional regulator